MLLFGVITVLEHVSTMLIVKVIELEYVGLYAANLASSLIL